MPPPIYNAEPRVFLDGELDPRIPAVLQSMKMEEAEGGMSRLELRISNWASVYGGGAETAFPPGSRLALGTKIRIAAGPREAQCDLFEGVVSALEGECRSGGASPELSLLAEDGLQKGRLARRSRVFVDKSPAAIVREVAQGLGLTPVVGGLDTPSLTWAQFNESDLAFLRRLLARFDADLQVVGSELQVSKRSDAARGQIDLEMYETLERARFTADLAEQATSVSVAGWNARSGMPVSATAKEAADPGPGAGTSGVRLLARTFGARNEHLGHFAVSTEDEAKALAQAAFDRRARRFLRLDATAPGNPRIRIGCRVRVTKAGAPFDNTYQVVESRHLFDLERGYRTEFVAECAFLGA